MPITFDLESDVLYRQGEIKGEIKGIERYALKLPKIS
jgi:hypothetical protein